MLVHTVMVYMLYSLYLTGNVVDINPDALLMVLGGYIGASPNLKITSLCVLFVFAEVGWCPVWRIYFSTPSLKAKRWSPSLSSSLWVINTFTLPPSRTPWTVLTFHGICGHRHKHALPHSSIAFPQKLLWPGEWHQSQPTLGLNIEDVTLR